MVMLTVGVASRVLAVSSSVASTSAVLAQCREELSADQPVELRRRASLLVGKYLVPEASLLLGQCLQDEDAVVRRNALVSIGEETFHLRNNVDGVLGCLMDPEVNIRRLASSLLKNSLMFMGVPKGGYTAELLNDALADEDAEVRRNVLIAVQGYGELLKGEVLESLLKDSAPSTVILAIRPYLMSDAAPERLLEALLPLASHPDQAVRLALAETLAARPLAQLKQLYWTLAQDEQPAIRGNALALLLKVFPEEQEVLDGAKSLLMDEQAPLAARLAILNAARGLPGDLCWTMMEPMLDGAQAVPLREAAWRCMKDFPGMSRHLPVDRLVREVVEEGNESVRRIQVQLLRQQRGALDFEALEALQGSIHEDVRLAVFSLDAALPKEQRDELTVNGLLDDSESVRLEAIRRLGTLHPPQWKQLLCDSLEDPSAVIAAAAARGLLAWAKRDSVVTEALVNYLPHCEDLDLRRRLQERLQ